MRLFFVRAADFAIDCLYLVRALFAIVAAVAWRLFNLPGPRGRRKGRALLLAAILVAALVSAVCIAGARGDSSQRPGIVVDVVQDHNQQVCSLAGCTIQKIKARDIGVVIGQQADGSWIALGHARRFVLGQASIDLRDGKPPVAAVVVACNAQLDLTLLKFEYAGWLPCRPLDSDPLAKAWVTKRLGKMPVAPKGNKDTIAQAAAPAAPPPVEDVPPPRDPAPAPPPSAAAANTPVTVDWHSIVTQAARDGAKAAGEEVKKLQAEHGQQLRNDYAQAIAAQRTAGAVGVTGAKQAAIGLLKSQVPTIIKEAMSDASPLLLAQLKAAMPGVLSMLGLGALGATGPVGIGIAVGGLLVRSLKKLHAKNHAELLTRIADRAPQTGPTAALQDDANQSPPPKAPSAVATTQQTAPPTPAASGATHMAPDPIVVHDRATPAPSKLVRVEVPDQMAKFLNEQLDNEIGLLPPELQSELGAIVERARYNAEFVKDSAGISAPAGGAKS
jgi:hypothetical protein